MEAITTEEVTAAVYNLNNNKAAGLNEIAAIET